MNKGPVFVVDDDTDDWDFLKEAWKDLKFHNKLVFFKTAEDVLEYLQTDEIPFLILCDVNLPKVDGFVLKEKILNSSLNYKSIPFVFWSSVVTVEQIKKAYDLGGNGFFVKEGNLEEIKKSLADIVNYWQRCKVPE